MQRAKSEMAAIVTAHDSSGASTASASAMSAAQQTHDYRFNFGLSITITYNLGLLYERLADMSRAEAVYKEILLQTPHYIDCAYIVSCPLMPFLLVTSFFCLLYSYVHNASVSCSGYLRLGCMARDRGMILDASDWFTEAAHMQHVRSTCFICISIISNTGREYNKHLFIRVCECTSVRVRV